PMSRRIRRRPRRDESEEVGTSAPGWMVTYGDMVTLILVFFVMLFALSSLDMQRFQSLISALQSSWGILDHGRSVRPQDPLDMAALEPIVSIESIFPTTQMLEMAQELEAFIRENQLEGQLDVQIQERGVVVRFADHVLFDLGRADLKPESRQILDRVAESLIQWPNQIRVEGHTDNWPIRTERFPSNWELSTARATTVLRYLVEERGLDPTRMAAVGYGEYRPLRPNDTPENRAVNRRVDI